MIDDVARQWLASTLSVSLQFTVLAGLAALVVLALRSLTPGIRYAVWLVVLLRLGIPAGITSPVGILPSFSGRGEAVSAPGESTLPQSDFTSTLGSANTPPSSRAELSDSIPLETGLFAGWASVVLGLLAIQAARGERRRRRLRSARLSIPAEIGERLEALRREAGLNREVSVWIVRDDAIGGPSVQGFWRPRVLLPASVARSWRRDELDPVLVHELIHIKRWDPIARAVANLLQIVYFFHPVVWWVNRRLREEREKACDDAVVHRFAGESRTYVNSLLRLAEARPPELLAPELRMATPRSLLARRLRRMLDPRYDSDPRVGLLARSSLFVGIGIGFALSTEVGQSAPTQNPGDASPQIRARMVWVGGYFAGSLEELVDAERVEIGGDFTVGRPTTPVKPDAAALAREKPELFERLEKRHHLSARVIVGRDGRVLRFRFEGETDEEFLEPFAEVLRAARFDPTTHYERGPVMVEVAIDYWIKPGEERASLYEPGQRLRGDEVAEVVQASRDGAGSGAPSIREGLPRYVHVLEKGEAPRLDEVGNEAVFSFGLSIDSGGFVESANPFRIRSPGAPGSSMQPAPSQAEELIGYLKTFRFEPALLEDGSPASIHAFVDLRVSKGRVEVASRASGSEEELDRRFAEIYRLQNGRSLDLLPPPHPPERLLFYRTGSPVQARAIPSGPTRMIIQWKEDRPSYGGSCFGCGDLHTLLMNLGIRQDAVRFEGNAENARVEADLVMRDGASQDELLLGLSEVLREKFGLDLRFEPISEVSKTLILRGSIGAVPPEPLREGQRVLHVFTDRKNEDPLQGAGGGPFLDAEILVKLLASQLQMPVEDETIGPPAHPFFVQIHDSAHGTRRFDLLIQNLEVQTELEVTVEERLDERLIVRDNRSSN